MISLADFDANARTIPVEARRRAMLKQRQAIGSHEILSALVGTNELADLLADVGIRLETVVEKLGEIPPSAERLLSELGIDLLAVRSTLPSPPPPGSSHWRMQRSVVRPLRVTLKVLRQALPSTEVGERCSR